MCRRPVLCKTKTNPSCFWLLSPPWLSPSSSGKSRQHLCQQKDYINPIPGRFGDLGSDVPSWSCLPASVSPWLSLLISISNQRLISFFFFFPSGLIAHWFIVKFLRSLNSNKCGRHGAGGKWTDTCTLWRSPLGLAVCLLSSQCQKCTCKPS